MNLLYLPYEIIENHIVPNRFSKMHYNIFKLTCKNIYSSFIENEQEEWERFTNYNNLANIIKIGYRNIRINNIEFYIVNIDILTNNEREGKYRFFTLCGRIIYSYYGKIFFQLSIPPLYTQYNTHIPIKLKGVGKLGWRNNEVIIEKGMSTIEVLKYSNLFNAFSRPLP